MKDVTNIWKQYVSRNPFKSFSRKIKFSIQRIKKGYCDWDTWDLENYFSVVIPSALRQLAKETDGYPAGDFEDDAEGRAFDKWKAELNRIADLIEEGGTPFYAMEEDFSGKTPEETREYFENKQKKLEEGLSLLTKYWGDLWW